MRDHRNNDDHPSSGKDGFSARDSVGHQEESKEKRAQTAWSEPANEHPCLSADICLLKNDTDRYRASDKQYNQSKCKHWKNRNCPDNIGKDDPKEEKSQQHHHF